MFKHSQTVFEVIFAEGQVSADVTKVVVQHHISQLPIPSENIMQFTSSIVSPTTSEDKQVFDNDSGY